MSRLGRRAALGLAAGIALPRFAIGQSDTRPAIRIAVQRIANSNTLDNLREQSNVGERTLLMFNERLIDLDWHGNLAPRPGLAESWRRIDDTTVEFILRSGVKFHNGDIMTAEDVAFRFSADVMFGALRPTVDGKTLPHRFSAIVGQASKDLPAEIPPVARRLFPGLDRVDIVDRRTVRFVNATPDVTLEGRIAASGAEIISRRAFTEAASWLAYARKPVGTGPYMIREFRPDTMLILDAHDAYWGGRPPVKSITLVEVPEVSSRINGLLSGEFHFACDIPPDQISTITRAPGFEISGGTILNHRLTPASTSTIPRSATHGCARRSATPLTARRSSRPFGMAAPACRPGCNFPILERCRWLTGRFRPSTPPAPATCCVPPATKASRFRIGF